MLGKLLQNTYYFVRGLSQLGDWLNAMLGRWILVAVLGYSTYQANLTRFLAAIVATIALSYVSERIDKASSRKVLALTALIAAACSAVLGVLLQFELLNWGYLTLVGLVSAYALNIAAPHADRYKKEIAGGEQKKLSYFEEISAMGSRAIAGLIVAIIAVNWAKEGLFYTDAISFLPFVIFIWLHQTKYKLKVNKEECEVLGPIDGARIASSNSELLALLASLFIASSFGNLFNFVPEILNERFHSSTADYGIWLSFTGGAGLVGAVTGNWINKRWPFSLNSIYLIFIISGFVGVYCGFANSYLTFTGSYMLYVMLQCIVAPSIDGLSRLVLDGHLGAVARFRSLMTGPVSQGLIFLISLVGEKMGYLPQQVMMGSACFHILLLGAMYLIFGRRHRSVRNDF